MALKIPKKSRLHSAGGLGKGLAQTEALAYLAITWPLLGRNHTHHVEAFVGVAPLVVVPSDDFEEGVVQRNAGISVKHAGAGLTAEVGGHHFVFGVAQDAFQRAFGLGLHFGADFGVSSGLFQLNRQVDHRHVRRGHAKRHAGQLLVQRGNHHADGLGRARAGRNDVFQNATATAPVFVAGAVHGFLRGGRCVDGGHQTALNAPLVVEHLGDGCQAVGGARSVADDGLAGVALAVDAMHKHRRVVFGRRRHDDFLRAGIDVLLRGFFGQEQAGGFDDDVSADFVPLQVSRVALLRQADFFAVDDEHVALDRHGALEAAMHRVVLQHVRQVVRLQQVVDAHDFDVAEVLHRSAKHHAADTAKAVDTNLDRHKKAPLDTGLKFIENGFKPR